MLRYIIPILLIGALTSCDEPVFDRVPGESVKKIPKSLRGEFDMYSVKIEAGEIKYGDTVSLSVKSNGWTSITHSGKVEAVKLKESDNVISVYKDYIFISEQEKEGWNVIVIEPFEDNYRLIPAFITGEPEEDRERILKEYFTSVEYRLEGEKGYYFVKMNEVELLSFAKMLGNKEYFILRRTE
jgi:hypothetical protein